LHNFTGYLLLLNVSQKNEKPKVKKNKRKGNLKTKKGGSLAGEQPPLIHV